MDQIKTDTQVVVPAPKEFNIADFLSRFAPLLFLLVLMVVFTLLNARFLSPVNIFNIMRQVSITGLIAIGMTFVILTGGIDLSVGALLALAGMTAAVVAKGTNTNTLTSAAGGAVGYGTGAAILAAILVGMIAGFLQGTAITRLGVPAFVVTLGGMTIFRGATLLLSNGGPISTFDESYQFWGQGKIPIDFLSQTIGAPVEIPIPVIIFLSLALLAHIILRYTRYGRHVYAVGGNREAARLSGLNVNRITASVYVIVGFFAGLGGFVLSSRHNSSEAIAGQGDELTVIASVVIGGTSLFGGEGRVLNTVIGSLLIGVLRNGLVLIRVDPYIQQIIIGVVLVLAVAFDRFVKARRSK
jgi:ribose/xylose/arabinose/galactoside ABC-type transport system permease subunit